MPGSAMEVTVECTQRVQVFHGNTDFNGRLERRTRDRKVPCSSPGRSGARIFFSIVNFLC